MSLAKRGDMSREHKTNNGLSAQCLSASCWETCVGSEYLVPSIQQRVLICVFLSLFELFSLIFRVFSVLIFVNILCVFCGDFC